MKKLFVLLLTLIISSVLYISCSDSPISGYGTIGTTITKKYVKTTPYVFFNGIANDFVNVPDTGFTSSLIYELDTIALIDVTKIDIMLEHNGIVDTLVHNLTNPGNNFIGTKFSDQATDSIKNGSGDYTGTYKPYRPLSIFNNQSIIGPWNLQINYWGNMRTGVIKSWGITISYNKSVPSSGGDILPLALNNQWVYEVDTNGGYFMQEIINVSGTSIVHGKQVYWWQWQSQPSEYQYVRNENDGLWSYGTNQDTTSPSAQPHLLIKYPINLNETYYTRGWLAEYDTITCISKNATYANQTGCIQYYEQSTYAKYYDKRLYSIFKNLSPNSTIVANFYFKPGLGLVGMEMSTTVGSLTYTVAYKLTSYTLH